jgi:hypothetical protein
MTDHEIQTDPPADPAFLTIDALIDGERVDPEALRYSLARPDVRDYLVDALRLRGAIAQTAAAQHRHGVPSQRARPLWWAAAAAAVCLSLVSGYALGQRSLVPALEAATVETYVSAESAPPPPVPTHTVILERQP